MNSNFLNLNVNDLLKGLIVAILTAIITGVYNALNTGVAIDIKLTILSGLTAGLGYLLKNFFTNSDGNQLKKEQN